MSAQQAEAIAAITAQLTEITEHLDSIKDLLPALLGQAAQPATDAPEPAQTLADLMPCLGDRVRVRYCDQTKEVTYGWREVGGFCWRYDGRRHYVTLPTKAVVLERLDPVTPEEPPVGAGMLVDSCSGGGCLRKCFKDGWRAWDAGEWLPPALWEDVLNYGPFRPATPADLAEHGVDEQGEPVGKGEAFSEQYPALRRWLVGGNVRGPSVVHDLNAALDFLGEGRRQGNGDG